MRHLAPHFVLCLVVCAAMAMALGVPSHAQVAAPLQAQQERAVPDLVAAFAAAGRGDWAGAEAAVATAGPLARDLVTWSRLRAGEATFAEHVAFLAARPDWPGLDRVRARAEEAIAPDHHADEVIAFFADVPPQTGPGGLHLANALTRAGRHDAAAAAAVAAWTTLSMTQEEAETLLQAHPSDLMPHHFARAEMLLWRGRLTEAARMVPLLAGEDRALVQARLATQGRDGDMDARLAAVPQGRLNDPGLNFDRFSLRAGRGDYTDAVEILAAQSTGAAALGDPSRWASWRRVLARWEMRQGRADAAYALATAHFLTEAEAADFADLEWLAGYLALTYKDDAALALRHFQRVAAAVEGAISVGRAEYWAGRAHEALGDDAAATAAFARAAQHQSGFYGLLAAERLGQPLDPALAGGEIFAPWREAAFLNDDLAQAALLLMAAGERGAAVQFLVSMGRDLDRTALAQMGDLLAEMDEPFFSVLLGKTAASRGIILPAMYFPLHGLAQLDLPVAPAFALAISRRESEFNPVVGSPAGALGLMQLMPATAEEVARDLGLPYTRARLTADWEFNAILGARYLANLQEMFGDSPVLIAAGYNAGPSRPRSWITERGDPRGDEVDVIDWIEHIPFRETRDYVMRVTETIPIYQARLTGGTDRPLGFSAMLKGQRPFVRPVSRPAPRAAVPAPGVSGISGSAQSLRPMARPDS